MAQRARRQNFQTISWFWDLKKRDLLDLDPPYQRRSVWNQSYKDNFVDTILMQYPAPAIFLYEEVSVDGISKYHVVDGKQRLTAVFEFAQGAFPAPEGSGVSSLRGKYFESFSDDDKTAFWTYQFSVEYLPTNDETIINSIFERINRNTAKLTRQELRHARFSGPFISTAEEMVERMTKLLPESFPRIESQSRKQMKDVELVANLLLFLEDGPRGYSQEELDQVFSDRESSWENGELIREQFLKTLHCLSGIVRRPDDAPIFKSRMRNQADFYSLFTAVADRLREAPDFKCDDPELASRLSDFANRVDDEELRKEHHLTEDYFAATRSNSNDTGPRKMRTAILKEVLKGNVI